MIISHVDYRSDLGVVRDQGRHPTCLAHAVSTAHEFARQDLCPLSAEYLYFFATNRGVDVGTTFPQASKALRIIGQPAQAECGVPDMSMICHWMPSTSLRTFRRMSESVAASGDKIAEAVHAGHMPVIGITLPRSFFAPTRPWRIKSDGTRVGLHAVVVVALAASAGSRLFGIRNSWGKGWGDDGHAWLGDDFFAQHLEELLIVGEVPEANG